MALLVGAVARGSLNDYESMELSRHRLGRERSVIFTFLKRLGEAFTTDVEVDQVLGIILESALETTDASAGAIYLFDAEHAELDPRVVLNFFPPLYVEASGSLSERRTRRIGRTDARATLCARRGRVGRSRAERPTPSSFRTRAPPAFCWAPRPNICATVRYSSCRCACATKCWV